MHNEHARALNAFQVMSADRLSPFKSVIDHIVFGTEGAPEFAATRGQLSGFNRLRLNNLAEHIGLERFPDNMTCHDVTKTIEACIGIRI